MGTLKDEKQNGELIQTGPMEAMVLDQLLVLHYITRAF